MKAYLFPLSRGQDAQEIGNKAASIQQIRQLGLRAPRTYVLSSSAYRQYVRGDPGLKDAIGRELESKLDLRKRYAVRSSANLEDGFDHSFAGQFTSVLDVQGKEALLDAIRVIWDSICSSAVTEYLGKRGIDSSQLCLAVIIQEMVQPVISGVSFSRNPITGAHETVVEAVRGPGSQLVQEGVTPDRWIYRHGDCTDQPEASAIPCKLIEEVARTTRQLAQRRKKDLDLEWVYDGQAVHWVQMRDITTRSFATVYSNQLAREMLGGMTKPLIWSVNIPLVNSAWIRLMTEVVGPNSLTPELLARSFYYRVYFNMSALGEIFESVGIPADSLEMMWGIAPKGKSKFQFHFAPQMLGLLPRAARFLWDKATLQKRLPARLAALEAAYRKIDLDAVDGLSSQELLAGIDELYALNREAAYYNIVVPLSMYIYNTILHSQLRKFKIDPAQLDMQQNTAAFLAYDPGPHFERLHQLFQALPPEQQQFVASASYEQVMAEHTLDGFRTGVSSLLDTFGHLSDHGNDFSTSPWRENRETVLKMITAYQPPSHAAGQAKIRLADLRLPFGQGWMLSSLQRRASQFMLYRAKISHLYTYGYGLFRVYFLGLGRWMQQQGWIDLPEDIFYLELPGIRRTVEQGQPEDDLRAQVAGHKAAMENLRAVVMPPIIYGEQPPVIESRVARKLTGTPTSRGYCSGRVRVVNGIQDFGKVRAGDILVIPFSDVGWTPLFASAAGVIAEAGGILSHSSIIAREYGIPAVVSVAYAMQLRDDTLVSIDGYKGEILIHEEEVYAGAQRE